jgi:hypothetical protein
MEGMYSSFKRRRARVCRHSGLDGRALGQCHSKWDWDSIWDYAALMASTVVIID